MGSSRGKQNEEISNKVEAKRDGINEKERWQVPNMERNRTKPERKSKL